MTEIQQGNWLHLNVPLDPLFDRESFVADHFQVTLLARALPDMTHLTELVVPYIATNRSLLNNMILFYILHENLAELQS